MSDVTCHVEDNVAEIALNRPESRNAMNASMIDSLVKHVEDARDNDEVRVVLLRSEGDIFCGGGDVNKLGTLLDEESTPIERREYIVEGIHRPIQSLVELEKPVVCRLQGDAIGAGANLVLACDIIVAAEEASLIEGFKNVGLAIDCGGSYLLTQNTSLAKAKELVMTGRPVDATEAEELGLVNHAVPASDLDDTVSELVEQLRTGPTRAIGLSKRLLHEGTNVSFDQALENEARANAILGGSDDHAEGIAAFREKRHPDFSGE